MSNPSRVIKGSEEPEGPFSQMSVEPVLIGADGQTRRKPAPEPAENKPGYESELDSALGNDSHGAPRGETAHNLAEARQQAASILELSRQGAEDLKREAEAYAEQIRAQAEAEAEDRRANAELEVSARLTQEYAEQYQEAIHALADAVVDLKTRREDYLNRIEGPAYELVLALGRRLINAAWERDETLRSVLREALGLLRPEGAVRLYLHPSTLQRAQGDGALAELLRGSGLGRAELELLADAGLPIAGYRLDTGSAAVRFNLDEALDELMERLRQQRPGISELQIALPEEAPAAPAQDALDLANLPEASFFEGEQ